MTFLNIHIFLNLILALVLGAAIGIERIHSGKSTGVRVFGLVSLGSALFVVVSQMIALEYAAVSGFNFDPLRVTAQIVTGIGFLGAGMIIFRDNHLENLNTAAGIWLAAGIGVAAGFGLHHIAIFVTLLVILAYAFLHDFEEYLQKLFKKDIQQTPTASEQD